MVLSSACPQVLALGPATSVLWILQSSLPHHHQVTSLLRKGSALSSAMLQEHRSPFQSVVLMIQNSCCLLVPLYFCLPVQICLSNILVDRKHWGRGGYLSQAVMSRRKGIYETMSQKCCSCKYGHSAPSVLVWNGSICFYKARFGSWNAHRPWLLMFEYIECSQKQPVLPLLRDNLAKNTSTLWKCRSASLDSYWGAQF